MDPRQLEDFANHVAAEASARGVVLTPAMVREVYATSLATGFTPQSTVAAIDGLLAGDSTDFEPGVHDWDDDEDEFDFTDDDEENDDDMNPGLQRLQFDFGMDAHGLQQRLGRPLTSSELDALSTSAIDQAARHNAIDLNVAARDHGIKPWSEMDRGEINRAMADRVRDTSPETFEDPGQSDDREYDINNSSRDFVDYAVQRMNGVEFQDTGADYDNWDNE